MSQASFAMAAAIKRVEVLCVPKSIFFISWAHSFYVKESNKMKIIFSHFSPCTTYFDYFDGEAIFKNNSFLHFIGWQCSRFRGTITIV